MSVLILTYELLSINTKTTVDLIRDSPFQTEQMHQGCIGGGELFASAFFAGVAYHTSPSLSTRRRLQNFYNIE